jgi:Mg2+-importing ATPase
MKLTAVPQAPVEETASSRHPGDRPYWSQPTQELLRCLGSGPTGLATSDAEDRLATQGPNVVAARARVSGPHVLLRQFRSPLVLILLIAAAIAGTVGDRTGMAIIVVIVLASTALGFAQEFRASRSIESLRKRLGMFSKVWRDGSLRRVPARDIVAGDVVELSAGSLIPADGVVLAVRDCFVVQSVLTGESLPVEKLVYPSRVDASLPARTNAVFMGTSVRSGTARMLVVRTGARTLFGEVASRLRLQRPETEFERGVRRFSSLLTELVLVMTVVVMAVNLLLARPALESLLFAIALAVGITPELLPAIVTFTLSRGAQELAAQGVLVRRLASIENLGSMTVLCADKTGTLTVGVARLSGAVDADGASSARVLELAVDNARLQTGLANPLDDVILAGAPVSAAPRTKVDEIPYDFSRKRMSVAAVDSTGYLTIAKGAVPSILSVCTELCGSAGTTALDADVRRELLHQLERYAREGLRVLAVASRRTADPVATESAMTFEGFLLFEDPPKPDIIETLAELRALGVSLKIVTGDNRHTARHVAEAVGMRGLRELTGEDLLNLRDEALWRLAESTDIFAEVDPNQKERIILALRRSGHVVGYLGDGINDAPALHAADVGISVEGAVDVAREAADLVLLAHDLRVVNRGIRQGRVTFANTQKYILSTTSANFGNMLSMVAASAFLPFLPMTAAQILLNNLLSDIPAVSLAGDRVDPQDVGHPPRWSMRRIRAFTVAFGCVSSVFDLLTFVTLLWLTNGSVELFRSGWFLESLATEVLVLLVIRTRHPVMTSSPSRLMLLTSGVVLAAALLLLETAAGRWMGFVPLPPAVLLVMAGITLAYAATVEWAKRRLYRVTEPRAPISALRH